MLKSTGETFWVAGNGLIASQKKLKYKSQIKKSKIDDVIHKYIGKQTSDCRCSANWKKARKENPEMRQELIQQLKMKVWQTLVLRI